MRTAIIGYGKMGHEIATIAQEKGHSVDLIIDMDNASDLNAENLAEIDVAIEFTTPGSAVKNIMTCLESNTPVVSGSTGWLGHWDEVVNSCRKLSGAFFYASNYSIGVNVLFAINKKLADVMEQFPQYNVSMEEVHHIHKKDAPSGTAISLAEQIIDRSNSLTTWTLEKKGKNQILIDARREDEVPGIHRVTYDSSFDTIEISHSAKSRKGFATGAVMAAEFLAGKTGVFSMEDMFKL